MRLPLELVALAICAALACGYASAIGASLNHSAAILAPLNSEGK